MIGNHLVYRRTDRPTDLPTDRSTLARQFAPSSFKEWGHNKYDKINLRPTSTRVHKHTSAY